MSDRPITSVRVLATGSEVDGEDERPDEHQREDAAQVVDRLRFSWTCAGTNFSAMKSATTATGSTTKKTQVQVESASSNKPDSSGPLALIAPPMAAHRAIERVRAGPGPHSAAIKARVVG